MTLAALVFGLALWAGIFRKKRDSITTIARIYIVTCLLVGLISLLFSLYIVQPYL